MGQEEPVQARFGRRGRPDVGGNTVRVGGNFEDERARHVATSEARKQISDLLGSDGAREVDALE
ncbi:hypothetical protein GCM10010922_03070 [Microbacterium sorbitolivorans]|nr:hypothetical protein GCM10010922_03070 [Microbacterium sorbitolivorans]